MTTQEQAAGFEPARYLTKLSRRAKTADGQWKTIELDYMARALRRLVVKTVFAPSGCWLWMGHTNGRGYGKIGFGDKTVTCHRLSYMMLVAPIPNGLALDHLCRVKRCWNPDHLEPVTNAENRRRYTATITHCPSGHAYNAANTKLYQGRRYCRACHRGYSLNWWREQQNEAAAS